MVKGDCGCIDDEEKPLVCGSGGKQLYIFIEDKASDSCVTPMKEVRKNGKTYCGKHYTCLHSTLQACCIMGTSFFTCSDMVKCNPNVADSEFKCIKNETWSSENSEKPACAKFDVYLNTEDCQKVQKYNVDTLKKVPRCVGK